MADQEKPFDTTSIVLLLLVAGFSDIADLATDLIFPVPIIGQIVFVFNSLVVSPIVWAIIQFSFIMKTGMGRASLVAVAGGLGNIANIPGSETVTTLLAIAIANNPKVSEAASLVSKAGGKGGAASKKATGTGAKEAGAATEAETKVAGTTGRRAGGAEQEEMESAAKKPGEAGKAETGVSPEALGEEPEPMERLRQKLLSETPSEGGEKKTGGEESVRIDDRNNEVDLRRK
ncbi:MAG: hypothetical protein Q7K44_03975 [Candidatus Liptonbacteria bacterium]|nr:hypothetical protein [Candidatus Liptonbacteria bacterium]